ncbi:MAG: hypothetical protein JWP52_3233, partial [Rhizobacter sp.]|nr:hypothetical protein [Rhizobacter sp.]
MNSLRGRWCWWDVVLTVLVAAVLVALWSAVAQREWISPLFL